MIALFDQVATWAEEIVDRLGYAGVAMLVALENVFPPIPSEVILPLAGFVAQRGDGSVAMMIVAATIGSVVGAWILYAIAAAIGEERLHALVDRHGRWFGVSVADLVRAEGWFDRRASVAICAGRCVPLIRSLVSIPAGFRRVRPIRFTLLTAVGSAVWNSVLIIAGAQLGANWEEVSGVVEKFQWLVIALIVVALGVFAWKRLRPSVRRQAEQQSEHDAHDAV